MASTPEARAAVVGAWLRPLLAAAFLAGVSVWLRCAPGSARTTRSDAATGIMAGVLPSMSPHLELTPPASLSGPAGRIFGWTVDAPGAVVRPPVLRDAEEWPRGMVIKPPSTNDRIAGSIPGPLDTLLSALLAPWLGTAS